MSESLGHILIVDDLPDNRSLLLQLLRLAGYRVREAENGAQALTMIEADRPDLVLLDLMMPIMDGFAVLERLKAQSEFLPVIVVTAVTEREGRLKALALGADDFLNKPFDPDELTHRVRWLLKLKQMTHALARQNEKIEKEVAARTADLRQQEHESRTLAERLQAANEQLSAQAEELQAQTEELQSQHEALQDSNMQLRALAEQLQEVDALKDNFLSILSHELRTPLNAIAGFASVLDDEVVGPLTPQQHHYMGKILNGADLLLSLINDLLDMSRIQAGSFSLLPGTVRAEELCHEVVESLHILAERKSQRITCETAPHLPTIAADRQRVFQVLINLVNNAIKFSHEGAVIQVRVLRRGDGLRFEVEDNGPGIAEGDLPKLFRRFTQLETGNTRSANGTGLGLSISKALVEAHGGAIGVETAPGRGSVFWFELPASPVASRPDSSLQT